MAFVLSLEARRKSRLRPIKALFLPLFLPANPFFPKKKMLIIIRIAVQGVKE